MSVAANLAWSTRTGIVCLAWILLVALLPHFGDPGASALVVSGVLLLLMGAEWAVNGMRLTQRWERIVCYFGMVLLLGMLFAAVLAASTMVTGRA